jgi:hypothetical protein
VGASEILERERSRALPTAIATFAGVALLIVGIAVRQSVSGGGETESQLLADFPDDRGTLLTAAILQAAGMALLVAPLFYLFQAASARSEQMRHALIGITVAGPLFLALAFIFEWIGFDQAASAFAEPGGGVGVPVGEYAEDLIRDEAAFNAYQGLSFAGSLGLVVGVVYTSLYAMRVGLLTRFWGSLGMALGVSLLFLGLLGLLIFFLAMGLLIAGLWPRGRPPAWEEGRAVPWPVPGQQPEPEDSDRPAEPDEFAPTGEGSGTEVGAGGPADGGEQAGPAAPRKRKRRG